MSSLKMCEKSTFFVYSVSFNTAGKINWSALFFKSAYYKSLTLHVMERTAAYSIDKIDQL